MYVLEDVIEDVPIQGADVVVYDNMESKGILGDMQTNTCRDIG